MRELPGAFEQWVHRRLGDRSVMTSLAKDASRRDFYRVTTPGGSFVAMDSGRIPIDSWLDINALLSSKSFPVPKILFSDPPAGWAIMEDLGDTRLLDLPRTEYVARLEEALGLLEKMQRDLPVSECAESIAGKRHFTATFFLAELDHTLEHLFFRLLGVPPEEVSALQAHCRELCSVVADGPRVFTHRDYHSANLMVSGGRLVMVDWQDARFGPPEYDLVSLLRDSYVDLGPEWESMSRKFLASTGRSSMFRIASCACQRSLKAAGTFAFQYRAFEREDYLESLPRTLRYLEQYSHLCPRLKPLVSSIYGILDSHVSEIDLRSFRESDMPIVIQAEQEAE
jgi:aminoglycoside/choline kinase family phosphotransferase